MFFLSLSSSLLYKQLGEREREKQAYFSVSHDINSYERGKHVSFFSLAVYISALLYLAERKTCISLSFSPSHVNS